MYSTSAVEQKTVLPRFAVLCCLCILRGVVARFAFFPAHVLYYCIFFEMFNEQTNDDDDDD